MNFCQSILLWTGLKTMVKKWPFDTRTISVLMENCNIDVLFLVGLMSKPFTYLSIVKKHLPPKQLFTCTVKVIYIYICYIPITV